MEAPLTIVEGLRNIRTTMRLVWNPTAALSKAGYVDATGMVIQPKYEGRFELWDTDADGVVYMVTRVQNTDGSFLYPNDRWLEFIRHINPEHWGGDPGRMVRHFVDDPTELREFIAERDQDDVFEQVAKFAGWAITPKVRVASNNLSSLVGV
jgi:hypothetical protein